MQPRLALTVTTGITHMIARLMATGVLTISRTASLSVRARGSMAFTGAVTMDVVTMAAGTADAGSTGGVVGITADAILAAGGTLIDVASAEAIEAGSAATVVSPEAIEAASVATVASEAAIEAASVATVASEAAIEATSVATVASEAAIEAASVATVASEAAITAATMAVDPTVAGTGNYPEFYG